MTPGKRTSAEWGVVEQGLLNEVKRRRQYFEQAKRALDWFTEELQRGGSQSDAGALVEAARRYDRAFEDYRNALHSFSCFILDGRLPPAAAAPDEEGRMNYDWRLPAE